MSLRMGLNRDRRGAVALMVAVMSPMLLGFTALTVDGGFWLVGQTRLQVAADAGAMGASFLLVSSSFKALSAANRATTAAEVAQAEATGAMTKMMGTLTTPVTVSVASDYSSVTVTLYSQATSYFGNVFNITAPLMRATATAGVKAASGCVTALGTPGQSVLVDNQGSIVSGSCGINSRGDVYLNSGTINVPTITAGGTLSQSSSGSNSLKPATAASGTPPDPYAGKTAPTPGTCATHPDFTQSSGSPYTADPGTWCGNQQIGPNNVQIKFNPGVYIINNGDLTFSQANVTSAAGVTFVMGGSSPGSFNWTNYSNTALISAPTTGATAGLVVWQACGGSTQTTKMNGGGTLVLSGDVYAPCSTATVDNNAQIKAPLNGTMSFIAKVVHVAGGALLGAAGSAGTAGGSIAVLTQ